MSNTFRVCAITLGVFGAVLQYGRLLRGDDRVRSIIAAVAFTFVAAIGIVGPA